MLNRIQIQAILIIIVIFCTISGRAQDKGVARSANDFAFKLLHSLSADEPDKNLFFSPLSVNAALAIAYGGAQGETKTEMGRALSVSEISDASLDAGYQNALLQIAKPDTTYSLDIANALWMRPQFPFKPDFVKRGTGSYLSEILPLTTADEINSWAARKTHGRIKEVIQDIQAETILIITNAVYFKGSWIVKFDSTKTEPKDFHLTNKKTKLTPMMKLQESKKVINAGYRYYQGNLVQVLEMPYKGGRVSMYLFLPKDDLGSFMKELDVDRWHEMVGKFKPLTEALKGGKLNLEMPRLKLDTKYELVKNLQEIGMKRAFSEREADFGKMAECKNGNISISKVSQKAFVQVNEEGTEAAAVTTMEVITTSYHPTPPPLNFIVDRPYFFMLVDRENGLILFMGSVYDPTLGS